MDDLTPNENQEILDEEVAQQNAEPSSGGTFSDGFADGINMYNNVKSIKDRIENSKNKNRQDVDTKDNNAKRKVGKDHNNKLKNEGTKSGSKGLSKKASNAAPKNAGASAAKKAAKEGTKKAAKAAAKLGTKLVALLANPTTWIILGVILAIFLLAILLAVIFHSVISPLSMKYNVPEDALVTKYNYMGPLEDCDGEKYICNIEDTNIEQLDKVFENNGEKKNPFKTFWLNLKVDLGFYDNENISAEIANRIMIKNLDAKLDQIGKSKDFIPYGTILNTFIYAYDSQLLENPNPENKIPDTIFETKEDENGNPVMQITPLEDQKNINTANPMGIIANTLNKGILTTKETNDTKEEDDLNKLLNNLIYHEFYPTFSWGETKSTTKCDKFDNCHTTHYYGCTMKDHEEYYIDYNKYNLFLRYGDDISGYAFSEKGKYAPPLNNKRDGSVRNGAISGNTYALNGKGYEYLDNLLKSLNGTDKECILSSAASEALSELSNNSKGDSKHTHSYEYDSGDFAASEAQSFYSSKNITVNDEVNENNEIFKLDKFNEKAESDIKNKKEPKIMLDNTTYVNGSSNSKEYTYQNGWIYNRFPYYRPEYRKKEFKYEKLNTPLEIEDYITKIYRHSDIYNKVLGYNVFDSEYEHIGGSFGIIGAPSMNKNGDAFPLGGTQFKVSECFGVERPGGTKHKGIDLAVASGTELYARRKGKIVVAYNGCKIENACSSGIHYNRKDGSGCGPESIMGGGNTVIIQHDDGSKTIYYHLLSNSIPPDIKVGTTVEAGTFIGRVGSTGCSTGAHLHFEIRNPDTNSIDPYKTLMDFVENPTTNGTCELWKPFIIKKDRFEGNNKVINEKDE